jgi:uroporphyrinogen-III synthase
VPEANSTNVLSGRHVIITRAREQSAQLKDALEALGADVLSLPTTAISAPADWGAVDASIEAIGQYDWLFFASPNAANFFMQRAKQLGIMPGKNCKIAVVGPGTTAAVETHGLSVSFMPSEFGSEKFVSEFIQSMPSLLHKRILWPRGTFVRDTIRTELKAAGAHVDTVECYANCLPAESASIADQALQSMLDCKTDAIVFASSQAVHNFCALLDGAFGAEGWRKALTSIAIVSIGPETSTTCRERLGKIDVEAAPHTVGGLINALISAMGSSHAVFLS